MKRALSMLLAALLLLSLAGAALAEDAAKLEGPGFDTAEDAVRAYVEALNAADMRGMLSTFAIETYVDHHDASAGLNSWKMFSVTSNPEHFPIHNDYMRQLQIYMRYGSLGQSLFEQYVNSTFPLRVLSGGWISLSSSFTAEDFVALARETDASAWFGDTVVVDFLEPSSVYADYDDYMSHELTAPYGDTTVNGCDETQCVVAVVNTHDEARVLFFDCARYGDRWYNLRPGGDLPGLLRLNSNAANSMVSYADLLRALN